MKKLILIIMTLALSLCLFACGDDDEVFEPVASTAEESKVVLKFDVGGETYEVKYELYKALFVGNRALVDGGDTSVWSGPDAEEKIAEINEIIKDRSAEIYSVLHLAEKLGIDPYSSEADSKLHEHIKLYVHGGESADGTKVIGYGSYEKYLRSLAELGMNYSVGELMFRYTWALEKVSVKLGGAISVTEEELLAYYNGEDCARILSAYFQLGTKTETRVEEIRDDIHYAALAGNMGSVCSLIIQHTTAVSSEIIDANKNPVGKPIGFYELDDYYFEEYTAAAFSLQNGQVSRVIKVTNTGDSYVDGYYVVVVLEKTAAYFADHKGEIRTSYVNNMIGQRLYTAKSDLTSGASWTAAADQINHSELVK